MSEDRLNAAVTRASRAQALLNDELLTEAFDTVARGYLDAWMATDIKDQDKRERLWHAIQTVAKAKKHLHSVVDSGKLAQREIDDLVTRQKSSGRI